MVYVTSDGKILQSRPWNVRVVDFFWGILMFIYAFFQSLISPGNGGDSTGSGGGGGGSRPGGGGPGPGGPRKRMGRITTIQDCSMPGGG